MFYVAFNRGFVADADDSGWVSCTHNLREAQSFSTFEEADEFMKQTQIGQFKWYAILSTTDTRW